jgi:hypothetical protein
LPAADKNLEVILDKFFIFQKIIRNEVNQESITFDITTNDIIILDNKNNLIKSIKEGEIKGKSIKIFEKIKNSK